MLEENGEFAGLIPSDDLAELSEAALNNLLAAGKEMIDAYCQQSFGEDKEVPYIVKLVNAQLVSAILSDPSKTAESIEDYSYDNNLNAFSNILSRLNFLKVGEETICGRRKSIRAKVI
ncbi:MAG: hypothetical protein K1W37_07650 [Lachnospiraceae bacterium]